MKTIRYKLNKIKILKLIQNLKECYKHKDKIEAIQEMLFENLHSMERAHILFDDDSDQEQDPTVMLWLLYYTAMHFYFMRDFN